MDADIIMLDNFQPAGAKETAAKIKRQFPLKIVEISGGVTIESLTQYFSPGMHVSSSINALVM